MTPTGLNCLLGKLRNKKQELADLSNDEIEGCLYASKKALEIAQEEREKNLINSKIDEAIFYDKSIKEISNNVKKFGKEFKRRQTQVLVQ